MKNGIRAAYALRDSRTREDERGTGMSSGDSRFLPLAKSGLSADQLTLYRTIIEGPRARLGRAALVDPVDESLLGPFDLLLRSPKAGHAVQALGAALRFETALPGRLRELAILATAAKWKCVHEWNDHAPIARSVGLGDDVIASVHDGIEPQLDARDDQLAWGLIRALLDRGHVDDSLRAGAREGLGDMFTIELALVVGYYSMLAMLLDVGGAGKQWEQQSSPTAEAR